jgi:hypothetical protein
MSKLKIRIALSILISLGVIFAVATTVQGASLNAAADKVSSHSASGVMTNFTHDRLQGLYQYEMDPGHDCGSDYGPID